MKSIITNLYKLAGACPICGQPSDNNKFHIKCSNPVCENFLLVIEEDPEYLERTKTTTDFNPENIDYKRLSLKELDLEKPIKAELRALVGDSPIVFTMPEPFTVDKIPDQYKSKISSFFHQISIEEAKLYYSDIHLTNNNTLYTKELFNLYMFIEKLQDWFISDFTKKKEAKARIKKVAYGEVQRIVIEQDAKAALSVATRYQNDLPVNSIRKLEKVVLDHGTPDQAYLFAKDVREADIKVLEKKVLDSNEIQTIYVFCKNVDSANIKAAEDKIIRSGNLEYIRSFLQNIEGADTERLEEILRSAKK